MNSQLIEANQRSLDSWSSYTSCDSCFKDSSWVFLNSSWVSTSTSTVSSDSYLSSESMYCNNYSSSGELTIRNSTDPLSLSQVSGVSYTDHPTCYWSISNPSLSQISFNIQRSPSNFEDIYIIYLYNSQYYFLSTKQIASWSSASFKFTLNNISNLTIKVKRLNAKSDYSININTSADGNGAQTNYTIAIIIASLVFSMIIALVIFIGIVYCYLRWYRRRLQILRNTPISAKYIDETLGKMITCLFRNWEPKYKQESWIIWLENFEQVSQIHITNECSHLFHSDWLKTWYSNKRGDQKLTWPHWSTENSPNSVPLENWELSSIVTFPNEGIPSSPAIWNEINNQIEELPLFSPRCI